MKRMHSLFPLSIAMLLLLFASCRSFEATAPAGFATYEEGYLNNQFRAITPEGVRYRVREVKNEPEGDEALWTEALRRGLEKRGYRIVSTTTLRTDEGKSLRLINSLNSIAGVDYSYLTAFTVKGKMIVLVEAAGPKDLMTVHEKDLQTAIRALKLR